MIDIMTELSEQEDKVIVMEGSSENLPPSENALNCNTASGTKMNKKLLPKGLHAPPQVIVSDSNRFLWDYNDPTSPPESSSRSIAFSQLRRGGNHPGRIPLPFIHDDDDLYFNDGRFSPRPLPSDGSFPFIGSDSDATYPCTNITPRAIAEMDYNVGARRTHWIRSMLSHYRKTVIATIIVIAAVCASASMWRGNKANNDMLSTILSEGDTGEQSERSSKVQQLLIEKNVSFGELFMEKDSPQSYALEWVAQYDPLELDPTSEEIIGRYALAVFYFSATAWHTDQYVPSQYKQTWLSYQGLCHWTGVICNENIDDEKGGQSKVVGLYFSSENGFVDGPLVRELFVAFQGLRKIRSTGVRLSGSLPSEIGSLGGLQILSLGGNSLSGPIPKELGELSSLELLGLYENRFSSSIPREIGRLTRLSALYLDGNELTGSIPGTTQYLKRLLDFRVRDNKLSGTLPSSLGALEKLQILELDSNQFSGSLPSQLGGLTQLRFLQIHDNGFSSSLPGYLGNEIVYLNAASNNLTGEIPTEFANFTKLKQLTLTDNEIFGTISDGICELVSNGLRLDVDCEELLCDCCSSCDTR